jgi:hypothetical protein
MNKSTERKKKRKKKRREIRRKLSEEKAKKKLRNEQSTVFFCERGNEIKHVAQYYDTTYGSKAKAKQIEGSTNISMHLLYNICDGRNIECVRTCWDSFHRFDDQRFQVKIHISFDNEVYNEIVNQNSKINGYILYCSVCINAHTCDGAYRYILLQTSYGICVVR